MPPVSLEEPKVVPDDNSGGVPGPEPLLKDRQGALEGGPGAEEVSEVPEDGPEVVQDARHGGMVGAVGVLRDEVGLERPLAGGVEPRAPV